MVEWEDPPNVRGSHAVLFDAIRAEPGRWAVFARVKYPGGYMGRLIHGKYKGISPGEVEVRSHRSRGMTTIYVRIPPEGDT